jgi:hypothetical protein
MLIGLDHGTELARSFGVSVLLAIPGGIAGLGRPGDYEDEIRGGERDLDRLAHGLAPGSCSTTGRSQALTSSKTQGLEYLFCDRPCSRGDFSGRDRRRRDAEQDSVAKRPYQPDR